MSVHTERTRWGTWSATRMSSDALSVLVVPEVGARVVSLRDLRSGREWLLQAAPPTADELVDWSSHAAVFTGRASFGWDECLPTVAPAPDPTEASPSLRDHGDQWARPAEVTVESDGAAITSRWHSPEWPYLFSRRLSLPTEDSLLAEYTLENQAAAALPLLWSMHPTLAIEPGTRLEIPETMVLKATWANGISFRQGGPLTWPEADLSDGSMVDLSRPGSGLGWAAKLYAQPPGAASVIRSDGARLCFDWDHAFAPALGVWLSCGGWPDRTAPVEQLALEPTTSMDDDLAGALSASRERHLEPYGQLTWWVRLTLTP